MPAHVKKYKKYVFRIFVLLFLSLLISGVISDFNNGLNSYADGELFGEKRGDVLPKDHSAIKIAHEKDKIPPRSSFDAVLGESKPSDGKYLGAWSKTNTIRLHSLDGRGLPGFLCDVEVISVAFSPDGKYFAAGLVGNSVKLWSRDGKRSRTLRGGASKQSEKVNSVVFSPNGKILAAGFDNKQIKLWSVDGRPIKTFKKHTAPVRSVAFSPDGSLLVSGAADKTVKVWKIDKGYLRSLNCYSAVWSVAFSPDNKIIATGCDNGDIKLWSGNGIYIKTLKGHSGAVRSVAFSPDGKQIISGSDDMTAKLWGVDGRLFKTIKWGNGITCVDFNKNGKIVGLSSKDKTVKLCNLENEQLVVLDGKGSAVNGIAFSPDGKSIAIGLSTNEGEEKVENNKEQNKGYDQKLLQSNKQKYPPFDKIKGKVY